VTVTDAENQPTEVDAQLEGNVKPEADAKPEADLPGAAPSEAATSPPAIEPADAEDAGVGEVAVASAEMAAGAEAEAEAQPLYPPPPSEGLFRGTGRRKSAVARVRLIPGDGAIKINKRAVDDYFTEPQEQAAVSEPLIATNTAGHWNVFVRVRGGGHSGQAGAIRLGVARALVKADSRYEPALRQAGYLTRDSRRVERKKYGQRKARRRFQFSKR
jgi:small subunit ribosomal protein S9